MHRVQYTVSTIGSPNLTCSLKSALQNADSAVQSPLLHFVQSAFTILCRSYDMCALMEQICVDWTSFKWCFSLCVLSVQAVVWTQGGAASQMGGACAYCKVQWNVRGLKWGSHCEIIGESASSSSHHHRLRDASLQLKPIQHPKQKASILNLQKNLKKSFPEINCRFE